MEGSVFYGMKESGRPGGEGEVRSEEAERGGMAAGQEDGVSEAGGGARAAEGRSCHRFPQNIEMSSSLGAKAHAIVRKKELLEAAEREDHRQATALERGRWGRSVCKGMPGSSLAEAGVACNRWAGEVVLPPHCPNLLPA